MDQKQWMIDGVNKLNQDYALYVGQLTAGGEYDPKHLEPTYYLAKTLKDSEWVHHDMCVGFLLQFMEYDDVSEWVNDIDWDAQDQPLEELVVHTAVHDLHNRLLEDNELINKLCDSWGCSEYALFSAFENVAQQYGFELQPEASEE